MQFAPSLVRRTFIANSSLCQKLVEGDGGRWAVRDCPLSSTWFYRMKQEEGAAGGGCSSGHPRLFWYTKIGHPSHCPSPDSPTFLQLFSDHPFTILYMFISTGEELSFSSTSSSLLPYQISKHQYIKKKIRGEGRIVFRSVHIDLPFFFTFVLLFAI